MPRTPLPTSATGYTPSGLEDRKGMLDLFPVGPEPQTELARYRILSPKAGVRVSPLCLGAMSLGDQWTGWMGGKLDQEESNKLLDAFYEAGGNFIDTANNYQDEQSELIIGEWMEKRKVRDEIVLATKYTTYAMNRKEGRQKGLGVNYMGNHVGGQLSDHHQPDSVEIALVNRKSLYLTVSDSLKKLRTSYIDLLYVHWWDYTTSVEEVMLGLNDLVREGKVMYLGVSDTPAWIVAQANQFAREHALQQFVVYQGNWSLAKRDMERDIIPMCRAFGMAVAPWGVMGGGKFKDPDEIKARKEAGTLRSGTEPTEDDIKVSQALKEVAQEIGGEIHLASIALAWCRQMYPDCYPLIGGTKLSQLRSNIDALKIHLTPEQMEKLSNAVPFDWGFPYDFFGRDPHGLPGGTTYSPLFNTAGRIKFVTWP